MFEIQNARQSFPPPIISPYLKYLRVIGGKVEPAIQKSDKSIAVDFGFDFKYYISFS